MLDKRGVNSRPDSYRVLDRVWTDRPSFSLCAAPLELFGPGFCDGRVDGMNEQRSGYTGLELVEGVTARGGVEADNINGK